MRWVIWTVLAVLLGLGTAFVALTAAAVGWLADVSAANVAATTGRAWGDLVVQMPVPSWLALWVDPAAVKALQASVAWALDHAGELAPWAAQAAGWLVPLLWAAWALLAVLMLLVAIGLHVLVGRVVGPATPGPGAGPGPGSAATAGRAGW